MLAFLIGTILALLFIMAAAALLSGCSFTKKAKSEIDNNSHVVKNDSVAVSKSGSANINESTWFKEWISLRPGKDSFVRIETQMQPIYNTQPIMYYREGGTNKQEQTHFNIDSFAHAISDSINKNKSTVTESTEAEVLSPGQMLMIIIGALLFLWLVPKPNFSFNK